ncbi:MAG: radical SAM protein [Candidatus Omnitrophota bacterium]
MTTDLPNYIEAFKTGRLAQKAEDSRRMLESCRICPRQCGVNRLKDELGFCRTGRHAIVCSFFAHHGEEPPVSGEKGSGTIFFARCNMRCLYCQNHQFSQEEEGRVLSPEELADCMLSLQNEGCHNINLVTPTHVMPQILEALLLAASRGLNIPIVYNSSGYERKDIIAFLDGIVDIYLADLRYMDADAAEKFSCARDYPGHNQEALKEMRRQARKTVFNDQGIIQKGLIIRHLVLPENISGTQKALAFISAELSPETYVSLMSQYFPAYKAFEHPPLDRRLYLEEFVEAARLLKEYGLENGWVQESGGLGRFAGTHIKRNV